VLGNIEGFQLDDLPLLNYACWRWDLSDAGREMSLESHRQRTGYGAQGNDNVEIESGLDEESVLPKFEQDSDFVNCHVCERKRTN
jgi:hypothetical protein